MLELGTRIGLNMHMDMLLDRARARTSLVVRDRDRMGGIYMGGGIYHASPVVRDRDRMA